jgi:hypothetical protein
LPARCCSCTPTVMPWCSAQRTSPTTGECNSEKHWGVGVETQECERV